MNRLPQRKHNRLRQWDYSSAGTYFLTFCTRAKKPILSTVVGRGILDAPLVELSVAGAVVDKTIQYVMEHSRDIIVDAYVIMPNRVHLLVTLFETERAGASGMPHPTAQRIPQLVSSVKRYSNRECREQLWQDGYYDHIIRDEEDYCRIFEYIHNNPAKWLDDRYYTEH